jgi:2'-5' RNA ligase
VFSVELLLDAELERSVREDWDLLLGADMPSSGRNPAPSNRPHVTLAVRERVDPGAFAASAAMLPVPIELGGVVVFGHGLRFILARQVIVSAALLEVHRAVATAAGPAEPRYSNTAPDHWTPHVTLARGLGPDRIAKALRITRVRHAMGKASGMRVWDASTRTITTVR